MNKLIAGLFGVALMSGVAMADTGAPAPCAKDLSKAVEKVNYVEADVPGIKLSGYVDVGYIYNFYNQDNALRHGSDSGKEGNFNLNTVKLTLEKPLSGKNQWEAGFRADLMLGQDAGYFNGSSNQSNSASEFFLQQGYVVFNAPFGNGINIKAGKFASWLGYEVTERPANMNITYGDIYGLLPATLTGVSFEYSICNSFDVGLAVGNGADLDSNNGVSGGGFIDHGDGYGIMAKVNYKVPGGNLNWQNAVYYSWDSAGEKSYAGENSIYQPKNDLVVYDGVISWAPKFTNGKLLLGLNYDLGNMDGVMSDGGPLEKSTFTFVAGALYAKYQFNDIFSLAGRGSYVHNDADDDLWSFTLTAGFNLAENLVIRTEYRYDLGSERISNNYSSITHDSGHTVAVQAVYTF